MREDSKRLLKLIKSKGYDLHTLTQEQVDELQKELKEELK